MAIAERKYVVAKTPKFDSMQKPKPSREEIAKKVEEAKKFLKKESKFEFTFSDYNKNQITESTQKMLGLVYDCIKQGKRPVIILPDTSMRSAGLLFHAALRTAFPEIFAKDKLPVVFFVTPNRRDYNRVIKRLSPDLINLVKNNPNSEVMIFDYYHDGTTWGAIKKKLAEYNPKIETILYETDEKLFSYGLVHTKISGPEYKGSTEFEYYGRNGVMKPRDPLPDPYPNIIVANRSTYANMGIGMFEYRRLFSRRKAFYKLGIQIGQRFREQLKTQR